VDSETLSCLEGQETDSVHHRPRAGVPGAGAHPDHPGRRYVAMKGADSTGFARRRDAHREEVQRLEGSSIV
jgi:hypothetical protein